MRKHLLTILGILFFLICTEPGYAQKEAEDKGKRMNLVRMRVSDLLGETVQNRKGDDYGTVADIVVQRDGSIDYIILLHGGILGMGEKLIPIPWSKVIDSSKQGLLKIDVNDSFLENAPRFSEEEWEKFETEAWNREIEKYYGP